MGPQATLIKPVWPAPANVLALSSTRLGGHSQPPYRGFNLALHVGDQPRAVAANRALLLGELPANTHVCWLNQVHGVQVVKADVGEGDSPPSADASWSDQPGVGCAVMTADCLPVLFCAADGSRVAAAHAGWRGLQAGILEATVAAMGVGAGQLMAWLGPAIGPARFEVGGEVREGFLTAGSASERAALDACFSPAARPGHFLADLYGLARIRLAAAGLTRVYGGGRCTYEESQHFFSYRRDHETGRMATLVALRPALEK